MKTTRYDYILPVPATFAMSSGGAETLQVVVPVSSWLLGITIHKVDAAALDAQNGTEVQKNNANMAPTRIDPQWTAAMLTGPGIGFTFDMRGASDESESLVVPYSDRAWFEAGDAITIVSDGDSATATDTWVCFHMRRSRL